jgi:hypothetical protein
VKKVAHSTYLSLRFYGSSGWTREELEACLLSGSVEDSHKTFGDPHARAYFYKSNGSQWDFDKLDGLVSEVSRYSGAPASDFEMSTLEYMKSIDFW